MISTQTALAFCLLSPHSRGKHNNDVLLSLCQQWQSSEPDFDLEKLFLPAWAQDAPQTNRYANFAGEERSERNLMTPWPEAAAPRGPRRPAAQVAGVRSSAAGPVVRADPVRPPRPPSR